jgi:hypothetical protein
MNRYVGNLPPMPGVFPDYPEPVIRNTGDAEETLQRPLPDDALKIVTHGADKEDKATA